MKILFRIYTCVCRPAFLGTSCSKNKAYLTNLLAINSREVNDETDESPALCAVERPKILVFIFIQLTWARNVLNCCTTKKFFLVFP